MGDDEIGGIDAIGTAMPVQVDLAGLAAGSSAEAIAAGNLSTAMEGTMSGITKMPGGGAETTTFKSNVTGDAPGEVSQEKIGMVSDTKAEGGSDTAQDQMAPLMERYEKLYTDMTVFQVAWSIARRVQQDTSQLLRGQ